MSELEQRLNAALSSRYELEREIGRGGMAVVYLARDVKHDRQVALKVFQPDVAAAMGPARFRREIELATRLEHPHILSLYDSGEADGLLYYVMPYVSGGSLRDRLEKEGQLPIEDALRIAREMAEGLEVAHEQGVVHRDVKPGNVLLQRGHALLADFGVARALESSGAEKLTGTGVSVGTPQYMAPEQATGAGAVDGRSDVYAVGAVLYEMLTGEPPYTGSTPQAVLAKRMAGPPTPVPVLRETVPGEVDGIVQQAMARSAADRWQSAGELAKALAAAERGGGTPIPGLATWPGVTGEGPAVGAKPKRGRRTWAGIGTAAVLVAAIAGGILWRSAGATGGEDESGGVALPEPDPMLVLVVPERPANDAEWNWTGILADRVKNLGDLEVVDRRELQSSLLGTPVLATSTADSIAASAGASRIVIVRASEIGDDLRLNLSLYDAGISQVVSELDTTVSRFAHDAWAPASVVRLFAGQETGLAGEARVADLNSGLANPEAEIWASKGLSYWARGQYDSATIAFQRAVHIDSTYVEAWGMLSISAGFSTPLALPSDHDSVVAHRKLAEVARERSRALGGVPDVVKPTLAEARRLAAANPLSGQAQYDLYDAIRAEYWKHGWPPDSALSPLLASIELDPLASYNRFRLMVYYLYVGEAEKMRAAYEEGLAAGIPGFAAQDLWPVLTGLVLGTREKQDSILSQLRPGSLVGSTVPHRLLLVQDDMDLVARAALAGQGEPDGYMWQIYAALAGGQWDEAKRLIAIASRHEGRYLYSTRGALAAAGVLELPSEEVSALRDSMLADRIPRDITTVQRSYLLGLTSARLGDSTAAFAFADSLQAIGGSVDWPDDSRFSPREISEMGADLALEVRALVHWQNGRQRDALATLELQEFNAVVDSHDYWWETSRTFGRFLRAEILFELGRYEEAAGWYATIPRVKMGDHRNLLLLAPVFRGRARALDALGRYEEAMHYYRRFVTRWQDADPHLQPQVEEARQRIRELERELAG